jgi:hypothetical protein
MASAVIGALRVNLGLDSAAFDKGAKDAQSSMEKLGSNLKKAGLAIGAALAGAIVGVGVAVKGAIDEADKLGKLAQSVGVPVEELSALKHAADLSGVSLETLGKGLGRLSRNMVEAAQGLQTPKRAFDILGISIKNTDGQLKTVSEILPEIAGKFAAMRDGPEKTALAMQLLGRAGADLIPLLNAGKDGLVAMIVEARELGLVISTKTAKAAEAFNDNLTRLGSLIKGVFLQVTAELADDLRTISDLFVRFAKDGDTAKQVAEFIANSLRLIIREGASVILFFQRLGAELSALKTLVQTPIFGGQFGAAWKAFQEAGAETDRQFKALNDRLNATANLLPRLSVSIGEVNKAIYAPQGEAPIIRDLTKTKTVADSAKSALESYLLTAAKRQAQMQAELQTVGLGIAAQERAKLLLEAEVIAKEKNIVVTEAMRLKTEQLASSVGMLAERLEQAKTRFGAITSAAQSMASHFEDSFVGIIDGSKSTKEAFADLAKAIISDLARLVVKLLITIPLAIALQTILGVATGGGSFLGGSLLSGGLFGFAEGGSFKVGGAGGIDSQLVAFKASPDERVTVDKPGDRSGGGGELVVKGIRPGDMFTGEMVRSLAEKLIGFQRDGGQVVLAPT